MAPVDIRALPCPTALHELERTAARSFGAVDLATAALPGTEVGLRLLAAIGLPAPVRIVAPTYRTYSEALAGSLSIAFDQLEEAADMGGTIVLANPNNPDGRIIAATGLLDIARRLGERGGMLVVDEAFADFDPAISVLPVVSRDDPVLVFRSFGKFFGLAGLRLGFAVGQARYVEAIRAHLGSWPVSAQALAVGTAAYGDSDWIDGARKWIRASAAQLDEVLAARGLAPIGDCPLFRLVPAESGTFERLANSGVLVRPFDDAPGLLRFGLPPGAEAVARLAEALDRG